MLNVGTVIDSAATKFTSKYPRTKCVEWFNEILKDVLGQPRTWKLLDGSAIDPSTSYTDNVATVIPNEFSNLFITGIRMNYYDNEKDGRFSKESTMYQLEMSKVKALDNRLKGNATYEPHGYVRGSNE
jgi:hypothetical protein